MAVFTNTISDYKKKKKINTKNPAIWVITVKLLTSFKEIQI